MLDKFRETAITWDKATRRIYSPITANESDSNGRKLNIQVVNSGQVENLTGATLHLYWETKDKAQHGLDAFTASDISKGEFEIFYTTGMLSNVGELNATLVLVDATGRVVSDWFEITVTRGIDDDAIQSENSFSSLTQALIDISNLEQNYAPRLNDLTAQLQQTHTAIETKAPLDIVRTKTEKIIPEDLSPETLGLVTGTGSVTLTSIPQNESVDRPKMTVEMKSELNEYTEDMLSKVFVLHNRNFFNGQNTLDDYRKRFGSIKDMTLIGFDHTKEHRLRLFARNNASFNYRFIITSRDAPAQPWIDVFDAGADFVVTENIGGYTSFSVTKGDKIVKMTVDYNSFPQGLSANDGQLGANDGRYLIDKNCFYQNKPEGLRNEVESIRSMIPQQGTGDAGVFAKKEGDLFKVKYKYGQQTNMVIEFDKLGPNEIFQPRRFYKEPSDHLTSDFETPSLWYTLGTDWVSPYGGVTALTGTTTSFSGTVGGNHGTPSGHPTGEPISREMYADGVPVTNSETLYCDKVQIIVKSYVSASNKIHPDTGAKARSFVETITYTVSSGNMEVSVYLEALEDIRFDGYVGFQLTTNMYSGSVYFNDSANKYTPDGTRRDSLPLPWNGDRMVYSSENDVFVGYTNREVGLGDLSYKNTQPVMHLATNRKIYAHLLGTSVTVEQGDSIYYSGGYSIMEPLECEGAESAYFIKLNGEKVYCVDFLAAKSRTYLKLPVTAIGQQIEVVDKSESVQVDSIVSSDGLKISASEHGTIKFKIKGS